MFSLNDLNNEQRAAASKTDGPLLILAGAGSGKTKTITYRIANMIANCGIDSESILGMTFTNKAAREMQERVEILLGSLAQKIALSTFHSLGVKILKKEIDKLNYNRNFSIYDRGDQISIVREAMKLYKGEKSFDQKVILQEIGFLKNHNIEESDYVKSKYFDHENPYHMATEYCYHFYQEKLRFYNAIDFDDILLMTLKLFKKFPEIAQRYSERYRYIMIDEYQDTNPLQFQIILGLTSTHNNLCVVGDDDQSIYAFRGADVGNILQFEKFFPNTTVIKLEENYRSTAPILNLANGVIAQNKKRMIKNLWSKKKSDLLPILLKTGNSDHEAQIVIDEIIKFQKKGTKLSDIAVLYRGKNPTTVFEDQLRMNRLPYIIIGGQKFYDKKEIKDLIAYLALIQNHYDELALRRIINTPHRGIGPATFNKFVEKSKQSKISVFAAMERFGGENEQITKLVILIKILSEKFKTISLPNAISYLVAEIDFYNFISSQYKENSKQAEVRRNDLDIFIDSAARFEKYKGGSTNLKNFLEELMLQDSQDQEKDDEVNNNQVTLMTLHSAKGLEFSLVFLVGMEEDLLPHKKSISEGGDINEERRLCYVGVTRAKEKLIMTYAKERILYGKKIPRNPSRFLEGLQNLYKKEDRTSFNDLNKEEVKEFKDNFFSSLIDKLED